MAICGNCFNQVAEGAFCDICGFNNAKNAELYPTALPIGSVLNQRFVVGRVLGQGGFGVTYLAQDAQTRMRVAIKEYFPTDFVMRVPSTMQVRLHKSSLGEGFETGKQQFLAEARTLAEFIGDEHIVRIYRYFEENDTAYFAMEYVQGQALNKYLEDRKQLLTVDEANDLFLPLMESLANVHAKGIVHRDLSPDNIIIQPDGSGKIIDFGAARYSTGEMSKSLDVVLKHGFAPREQYTRRGRQGPFTDVYALAATYYFAITGKVPPDAIDRVDDDPFVPPSRQNPKISRKIDPVISKALAPNYKDRYQSMTEFREALIKACGPKKPTAEELNEAAYQEACKLQETSKTEAEYKAVSKKFEKLGNYKDSKERITQCGDAVTAIKEEQRKQKEEAAKRRAEEKEKQRLAKTAAKKQPTPKPEQGSTADTSEKKATPAWLKIAIPILLIAVVLAVVFGVRGGINPSPAVTEPNGTEQTETAGTENVLQAEDEEPQSDLPESDDLSDIQTVGGIVTFGNYEQDNDLENGTEPIEWIVLDVQDGKSLLISRYALDGQRYNQDWVKTTWENCTLRTWLNDTFLNEAFREEERAKIPTMTVRAVKNPDYDIDPGNDTQDQIFLLSIPEADRYFDSRKARTCQRTAYADAKEGLENSAGECRWWLRSPGDDSENAAFVYSDGSVSFSGDFVIRVGCAVRPAMWIDTGDLIETIPEEENDQTAPSIETEEGLLAAQTVGSIITFGSYEQDNDTSNGTEPIEWIVLDVQDGKSLLISRYGLDCQPYHEKNTSITWEKCTLRTWLNDTFLNEAFSGEEQTVIPVVTVTADRNPEYSTNPGRGTQDQVFILSIPEVKKYFNSDEARVCHATWYVKRQLHGNFMDKKGNCRWLLRSPGSDSRKSADINYFGSVTSVGGDVDRVTSAVRPALWVDLKAVENMKYQTVGNIVTFGSYEQDNDLENGTEPIEWIVLDVQGDRSLLISRYALDCQRYHNKWENITWENCTLRAWLNDTFLNEAFSEEERARIPTVNVSADKNPNYSTSPGNATNDQIFLLSIPEAEEYFASNEARACQATEYAKSKGSYVNSSGNCWWWLRSPGNNSGNAAGVDYFGSVFSYGYGVNDGSYVVRPALWINLAS